MLKYRDTVSFGGNSQTGFGRTYRYVYRNNYNRKILLCNMEDHVNNFQKPTKLIVYISVVL